jgi:ribulose-phosphate 3-epimerase
MIIAPSILAADFGKLKEEIELVNESQADWFHIDVMDGLFVPNISFGFPVMEVLAKYAKKPLDVHLMIINPERYIDRFMDFGIHALSVHQEASLQIHRTLEVIKKRGVKTGIALNPGTHEMVVEPLSDLLDFVNLMTVNPGFGGQSFINSVKQKISSLAKYRTAQNLNFQIELDGAVTGDNIHTLNKLGADIFVMGTAFFKNEDPKGLIGQIKVA